MNDLFLWHSGKPKRWILSIVFFIFLAAVATNILRAADLAALEPYLRKTTTWECKTLNNDVPVNIYYITRGTHLDEEIIEKFTVTGN